MSVCASDATGFGLVPSAILRAMAVCVSVCASDVGDDGLVGCASVLTTGV